MEQNDLQRALMAVLFAAGEPVDAKRLSQTLEHDEDEIHAACKALMDELSYTRSGIRIVRLENAYQMCSSPEMAEYVTKTLETRKPPKLSPSQLETLTVIAYYQPATKALSTPDFLRVFGLESLAELPEIEKVDLHVDPSQVEPLEQKQEESTQPDASAPVQQEIPL